MGRVPKRKLKEAEAAEEKTTGAAKPTKGRGRPPKKANTAPVAKENGETAGAKRRGRPPAKKTKEEVTENGKVTTTKTVKNKEVKVGTKRKREAKDEVKVPAKKGRGRPPAEAEEDIAAFKAVRERPDDAPGVVLTLGQGDTGQLGLGEDIMERAKPALVKGVDGVVAISAGGMHSLCLTKNGKVK